MPFPKSSCKTTFGVSAWSYWDWNGPIIAMRVTAPLFSYWQSEITGAGGIPNYMAKFNHYILGRIYQPITTLSQQQPKKSKTVGRYNHIHPITGGVHLAGELLFVFSLCMAMNQCYNKPYTIIPEAIMVKEKDWLKGESGHGSQPVVEITKLPIWMT